MNFNPLNILSMAQKAVPAVRYALALAGIAAAASIVQFFVGKTVAGVIVLAVTLVGMILVFVFSRLVALPSTSVGVRNAAIILLWSVVLIFVAFLCLTLSVFTTGWPEPWARVLGVERSGLLDKVPSPTPVTQQLQRYNPISLETLKNLTYQIDGAPYTLQDGSRLFNPEAENQGIHEKTISIGLEDHAFGDINGDGNHDAVAVLSVSESGGNAISYYIVSVINDQGAPDSGQAYELGDRVILRGVSIKPHKIRVELMTHGPNDGLCCPTLFRVLEFTPKNNSLQCASEPCSNL